MTRLLGFQGSRFITRVRRKNLGYLASMLPERPVSRDTQKSQTDPLTIGLVLAGVVAVLILAGATFFNSDEKKVDVTTNPPSTEAPVTD